MIEHCVFCGCNDWTEIASKKVNCLKCGANRFLSQTLPRSQRKQRLKKNLHLSYRTAIRTLTQMETNETLPLSQEEAKKRLVTVLALRINAQKRVDLLPLSLTMLRPS
jgi:hypothetical protein